MQVGDTGPAESTRQGNLQRVGLLFSGLAGQGSYLGSIIEEEEKNFFDLALNFSFFKGLYYNL